MILIPFRFRIFLLLAFLISYDFTYSQNPDFDRIQNDYMTKFDRFTKESGLSDNRCLKIFQDRYGYIWIGTENGLNRFDGHEFIQYLHSPNDSLSISNNFISDITEDSNGNLWIATHSGLNMFQRDNETFKKIVALDIKNSLPDNHVRALLADSIFIWIEALDGTLSRLNVNNFTFQHFKHQKITQPYYNYHSILKDNKGNIWIGGRNLGPCQFNIDKNTFTYYEPGDINKGKKRERDVACYFIDNNGTFWISATDGVYQFNQSDGTFKRVYRTSTFSIIQDKNRNIWFGTGKGVIRYNGRTNQSTLFLSDENNPNSISDNHINQVYEDHDGNIWLATDNGLSKYSYANNKFGHIYHIPENKNSLASNKVSSLAEDQDGNLWIGYEDKGFDKYIPQTQTTKHYNTHTYRELKSNRVSKLYFDKNNRLWIGLWQGVGFHKLNPETDKISHFAFDPHTLKRDWYSDFLEDSENNFRIGFWGSKGLHLFNRNTGEFKPDHFRPSNKPLEQNITALNNDNENIWIGNNNGYIYQYNIKNKVFKAYTNGTSPYSEFQRINFLPLFPFRNVTQIITDNYNQNWYITDKGIILHNPLTNRISNYQLPDKGFLQYLNTSSDTTKVWFINEDNLIGFDFKTKEYQVFNTNFQGLHKIKYILFFSSDYYLFVDNAIFKADSKLKNFIEFKRIKNINIEKVFTDNKDDIWIFGNQEIIVFNKDLSKIKYEIVEPELTNANINCFHDKGKTKWIGTNKGLFAVLEDHKIKHYHNNQEFGSNLSEQILTITSTNDTLWIGTDKGLYSLNITQGIITPLNKPGKNSLTSHLVSDLFEDTEGNIWVGTTDKGLNMLNPATGLIDHFIHNSYDSTSISNNNITCIFQDTGKNIWVGTMDGLNLLYHNSKVFKRIYESNGLSGNQVMSVIQDKQNRIWIGTNNGCSVYNPLTGEFKNYKKSDGLQSNEFTTAIKLKNGQIVLGGKNGINIFDPSKIESYYPEPKAQITGFRIFDKTIKSDFTNTQSIKINYKENFFTILFSSLNFSNPSQYKYLYKLEGVDPGWVKSNTNFEAKYTDVQPGVYSFMVKSISPDGKESNPKKLEIIIEPPFWRTIWFYLLVFLAITAIIGWIINLRFKRYKAEIATAEIEQRMLRTQMNPHFIFNALTSIQNFIYGGETKNANKFLTKFSRLLRLILQNSLSTYITLDDEIKTISNYLELQKMRFEDKFNYSMIIDEEIDTESVMIPPMLAQPFIENSIEHGFIERSKYYNLNILLKLQNNKLIYIIEDDGIGINKSIEQKKKNVENHKSLGMQITKDRMLNLKRFQKQNIDFTVEDLSTNNKNEQGTRVKLIIQLKNA